MPSRRLERRFQACFHRMFITEPDHELLLPGALNTSGSRHWRMTTLSLQTPWYLLTVQVPDGELEFVRTACIAWDTDLASLLESLEESKVVELLCMVPSWKSPTGKWWPREVRKVWTARSRQGTCVVTFLDDHGVQFGDQRGIGVDELAEPTLILNLEPGQGLATGRTQKTPSRKPSQTDAPSKEPNK